MTNFILFIPQLQDNEPKSAFEELMEEYSQREELSCIPDYTVMFVLYNDYFYLKSISSQSFIVNVSQAHSQASGNESQDRFPQKTVDVEVSFTITNFVLRPPAHEI